VRGSGLVDGADSTRAGVASLREGEGQWLEGGAGA